MNIIGTATLVTILILAAAVAPVSAKTLSVENNGVDRPTCGSGKAGPCRSISRAIANAVAGDRIVVGPGVYGDVDRDGAFTSPGDETAQVGFGCHCMLRINKAVEVVSARGASATVLSAGLAPVNAVVVISADDAVFGEPDKGFFVGADAALEDSFSGSGIRTTAGTSGAQIGGNVVVNSFTGFQLRGTGHAVEHNRATGNQRGFVVAGEGMSLRHNVAMGNEDGILVTAAATWLEANAVVGNRTAGIALLRGDNQHVRESAVLGNPGGGIYVDTSCSGRICLDVSAAISLNDIFGNVGPGVFGSPAPGNCGVVNAKNPALGALEARDNYWGRPKGPGPDPGDAVCNQGTSTANAATQFFASELSLEVAPQH